MAVGGACVGASVSVGASGSVGLGKASATSAAAGPEPVEAAGCVASAAPVGTIIACTLRWILKIESAAPPSTITTTSTTVANTPRPAYHSARLTDARYREGIESFLGSLDAQRSLYAARRQEAAVTATSLANLVELYRALGADRFTAPGG